MMANLETVRQNSRALLKDDTGERVDVNAFDIKSIRHDGENDALTCGIGPCRPRWLQWVAGGPKAFALWSMLYLMLKTSGIVYNGAAISTIEKQFQLSSTESGAIVIISDAIEMILIVFVAYFGHKSHRPRIIAFGVLLAGLGFLLSGTPHYMLEPYTNLPEGCNKTEPAVGYCTADFVEKEDPCQVQFEKPAFNPVWWLIIGQVLLGIGNVPMKPLGTTYIDDAVGKHTTPVYIAFLFIATSIGPLFGFAIGSGALSRFVDFDRVAPEDRPVFEEKDPRFIGAWWLGFICIGAAVTALSVPFFFFPKHLPPTKERAMEVREAKERETEEAKMALAKDTDELNTKGLDNNSNLKEANAMEEEQAEDYEPICIILLNSFKEMTSKYKRMLTNVGLLLLCLSSAMEGAISAGSASFMLKLFNIEFALTASSTTLLGVAVLPFSLLGTVVGGYVIKRRKWSPAKCTALLLFGDAVGFLATPMLMLFGCNTQAIAGISTPYVPPVSPYATLPVIFEPLTLHGSVQQARSLCNSNCTCDGEAYNPVCGADGLTYVSPCYAGCNIVESTKDEFNRTIKSFSDCRCINNPEGVINATASAMDGECVAECKSYQIPVLIAVTIIVYFCHRLGHSALVLITLRIVEDDMRSTAIGFQSLFVNLLGFFPAPIYFGSVFNMACILWAYDESERGACWVYNRETTRYAFHGLLGAIKLVGFLMMVGVYLAVRSPKEKKYDVSEAPPYKTKEKVTSV